MEWPEESLGKPRAREPGWLWVTGAGPSSVSMSIQEGIGCNFPKGTRAPGLQTPHLVPQRRFLSWQQSLAHDFFQGKSSFSPRRCQAEAAPIPQGQELWEPLQQHHQWGELSCGLLLEPSAQQLLSFAWGHTNIPWHSLPGPSPKSTGRGGEVAQPCLPGWVQFLEPQGWHRGQGWHRWRGP